MEIVFILRTVAFKDCALETSAFFVPGFPFGFVNKFGADKLVFINSIRCKLPLAEGTGYTVLGLTGVLLGKEGGVKHALGTFELGRGGAEFVVS